MIADQEIVLRLCVSAILGSLIGLERERLNWAAGLRTHMLVCVGSTLFMLVSIFGFKDVWHDPKVGLDPSRVAAQVVSGIGFLGAGNIVLRREVVRGLTTAASLWTVAAVGLAVGGGMYVASATATVIILGILAGLKPVEGRIFTGARPVNGTTTVRVNIRRPEMTVAAVEKVAEDLNLNVSQVLVRHKAPDQSEVRLVLRKARPDGLALLTEALQQTNGVQKVRFVTDPNAPTPRKVGREKP